MLKLISGCFLLGGTVNLANDQLDIKRCAICILFPDNNSGVNGIVSF